MRTFILFFAAALAALPQAPPPQARVAPRPQATRTREFDEGWVKLFNGKDLDGWVKVGKEQWTVEDGTIHGKAVTKEYGYLMTEKNYKDFQMTLRFKCEGDGNSGVFFHTDFKPGTADVSQGMQFEIDRHLVPPHRRTLRRRPRLDRLARAGERDRGAQRRLERVRRCWWRATTTAPASTASG